VIVTAQRMIVALVLAALVGSAAVAARPVTNAGSTDWTRFGYLPSRENAAPKGIGAVALAKLRRRSITIDGTVDSSAIYLSGVVVRGRRHDTLFATTTYGKTLALDASTGRVLWRFVPAGIAGWNGSSQITTATPVADPNRRFVYAASPDGLVHKLSVADGREAPAPWPVRVTLDPTHEKIASALNISHGLVLVTTGGYIGDAPPYQGHVVTIEAATGHVVGVFNSLCSDRRALIQPSTCDASDSAIWGRAGAVVVPGTGNLLVATGNGPWNGTTNWGDSVLQLSPDGTRLLQNWTPSNQAQLERNDTDLGSTSPAVLGGGLAVQGGKDGQLRLLDLTRLNGRTQAPGTTTGGELQTVAAPGKTDVFTAPAVWHEGGRTWLFVATGGGTGAYRLNGHTLSLAWQNGNAGTSPVLAGGLLYVYDPGGAGLRVYNPRSGAVRATLPAGPGHWNSPIVAGGRVVLPEGNANDHRQTGVIDIYSPR
jgi:putative pyrroloquinoline-quinone binding quinoprotein